MPRSTLKEFMINRRRAGILIFLVVKAENKGRGREAWSIYRKWVHYKISYEKAYRILKKLA